MSHSCPIVKQLHAKLSRIHPIYQFYRSSRFSCPTLEVKLTHFKVRILKYSNHKCSHAVFAHKQFICESLLQRYYYETLQKDAKESTPKDDCITNVGASSSKGWLLWLVDTLTGFVVLILISGFPHAKANIKPKTGTHKVMVYHGDILTCR